MKALVAQGNSSGARAQTLAVKDHSRGSCGYQSQVTGSGNGLVNGHKITVTPISQPGPLGDRVPAAISQGAEEQHRAPSRPWTPWAMPSPRQIFQL